MRELSPWVIAAAWLVGAPGWTGVARAQAAAATPPQAQSATDLEPARKRFAQARREEQASQYAAALEDFRGVRAVRETASVDYHIGVCLEALGEIASAVSSYESAARLGERDPTMADVTAASRERVGALSERVAHLALVLSSRAPAGVDVLVDGAPGPAGGNIVLDPGHHHVKAVAPGVATFDSDITLRAGRRASLVLLLDPPSPAPAGAAAPVERPRSDDGATRTASWISLGAGAVLLAAAVTSLALRESDIARAERLCPGGGCVGAIDDDAQAATDRARVEGPLGWSLGAAALVGLGVGAYMAFRLGRSSFVVSVGALGLGAGGLELRAAR